MARTFILLGLTVGLILAARAAPASDLYPFGTTDIKDLRRLVDAERIPDSPDLVEAWRLYRAIQGSWASSRAKPSQATLDQLDRLKAKLEALQKPAWLIGALASPSTAKVELAKAVGDALFERQKATPEYLAQKALAIVYLTEHELDRPQAANQAGRYLTALTVSHPWDWQLHGLYARLLADAKLPGPAWDAARQSIFLNPDPNVEDLKFFAFIGRVTGLGQRPKVEAAIRQAANDPKTADRALMLSEVFFSKGAEVIQIPVR
ncbi:MAG: hypothetical protein JSR48_12910 [Verrucomicrobia bacterium]|nr:hypothetical protein [Verrucomicrobiota bacterium]